LYKKGKCETDKFLISTLYIPQLRLEFDTESDLGEVASEDGGGDCDEA
jgi:hypothetical protein